MVLEAFHATYSCGKAITLRINHLQPIFFLLSFFSALKEMKLGLWL